MLLAERKEKKKRMGAEAEENHLNTQKGTKSLPSSECGIRLFRSVPTAEMALGGGKTSDYGGHKEKTASSTD